MPRKVALALSEGVPLFELAGPCAIFGTDRSELAGTDWYDFAVCSPRDASVDRWFRATTTHTYDDLARADTVIVPACHDAALNPAPDLVEAVREAACRGARVASICTGAFVLAAAGLLDGRRATTHWLYAAELAERYPRVLVDPDPLYIDHGDVLTSAGKSAGIDLCLHIVRTDYGAHVANRVARRLVSPPHRDGNQRQYVDPVPAPTAAGRDIGDTLTWALDHLDEPLTIEQLARHAQVSTRTLHRHFVQRTGTRPLEWLNAARVRRAQQLLETTDLTVERIAHLCGFGSPVALRRHMHNALDTTPDAYRRRFDALSR
ncbi:helix-turn-helix domain-containing protein [Tsukamurella sp. 8F]|uniref:GlxA family transcriptional regulator n=1 Tax=unclassified Tsukamurella TaxID=2633480 RepID=UPI0023B9FB3C|nr:MULTISPECIES: helix-turn-helix domain-containing protein [unclassified Tsukamurella]MDF0528700.1 helix-turn-helix domain-containing protein [Tsukamurella sp. 8J]MDF0585662.1 helix-turn-helix domain-containing protein [Tsukamurella sp. 8F]